MSLELASKDVHLSMPSALVVEMEEAAQAEGKTLDEITQDAMQQFLQDRRWQGLVAYGKGQARSLGLESDDVPRLIAEARSEQKRSSPASRSV
jgi:hypothetical protein